MIKKNPKKLRSIPVFTLLAIIMTICFLANDMNNVNAADGINYIAIYGCSEPVSGTTLQSGKYSEFYTKKPGATPPK